MEADEKEPGWISEAGPQFDKQELLQLYGTYQTRQLADLDMQFRFNNHYVSLIVVLLTAFAIGLAKFSEKSVAGQPVAAFLVAFPLLGILLAYHGKLASFRFYRRYTEGRTRLTKIEYLLGLDGPVSKPADHPFTPSSARKILWPEDVQFLPKRYFNQSVAYTASSGFIERRSWEYGLGGLTQRTLTVCCVSCWLAIPGLSGALSLCSRGDVTEVDDILTPVTVLALGIASWFYYLYLTEKAKMLREDEPVQSSGDGARGGADRGTPSTLSKGVGNDRG
jgi:hypothetical protein